ncbi:hypothetical protein [Cecembia lonarensis]|uniref:Uncharacterized protein n=1 Tax=Cecembia lonarensis (strain CCUG 58316 / KCTC 22772 / LW9) TaxID=1225176 RepID=K1LWM2_CECL9|nr:hypothetical protein [Cecembia lonarensis]EKB48569.1 hypothetical protein B879_02794 [Cecembia lonarensis LW9]
MKAAFQPVFLALLVFMAGSFQVFSQGTNYFSENRYADYPIISLKENFFGNPVYFIEGEKIKASEVRAYMEIMPGDANKFSQVNSRMVAGNALYFGGLGVGLGGLAYLFSNFENAANPNRVLSNFLILSLGGGVITGIGANMKRQGVREINGLLENHNYLIRQEEILGPYLKMDFRQNFLGEKIDIYEGPNLLNKQRLNQIKQDFPELQSYLQSAERAQNWSVALDIVSLVSNLVFISYVAFPEFQSSAPSNLIIPLFVVDLGVGISSSVIRRNARNRTRLALQQFNFRD